MHLRARLSWQGVLQTRSLLFPEGIQSLSLAPEEVFESPDTFSLERSAAKAKPHLGFGHGIHLCVGAGLARPETSCALNAVLNRAARMELVPGYRYRRIRFFMLRGPQTVDVRFERIGAEIPGGGVCSR